MTGEGRRMLEGFCEYLRRQGKSENTVKAYCQGMKEYMRWHEETFGKRMKMFLRANVLDYISYLRTVKGLSNRSVNAKLASLYSFNLYLIAAGYTKEVVLDKQDYLKVQLAYASPSTVSREEVERFRQEILEHCGVRDYAIVTILAYAGLRISECLALRVEDISLPAREIKVRHGKGDKMRVVYFGDKVVNAVREYLRNRPKTENPYLFPGRGDSHLTRSQVNRIFNEHSESITPHTLRHFFCSNALENGYTIADLANQAGHSNVHTTLLYTNPTREKMKEKANRL